MTHDDVNYEVDEYDVEGENVDYDDWDGPVFAEPGGRSALRAATKNNPRNLPCPNCGEPNRLTPEDKRRGYQCNECADRLEQGIDW